MEDCLRTVSLVRVHFTVIYLLVYYDDLQEPIIELLGIRLGRDSNNIKLTGRTCCRQFLTVVWQAKKAPADYGVIGLFSLVCI